MRPGLLAVAFATFALAACSTAVTPAPSATSAVAPAPSATVAASPTTSVADVLYTCESRVLPWDGSSAIDLTGTWAGDDQGVYYLRQIGDQVWWLGMSGLGQTFADRGVDWTNVYLGTLSGDTVSGTYADVPQGKILDKGPVVLKLTRTSEGGISLVRTDPVLETGFGGSMFTPCTLG